MPKSGWSSMKVMRVAGASLAIVLFCPAVLLHQEVSQTPARSGEAASAAASSCDEIHSLFPQAPAGSYWVDPEGSGSPFLVE
eukprot:SAG22_NODE_11926_length_463_cov_0.906593_2_plen_81_part_01